jgi:hypothetical protein
VWSYDFVFDRCANGQRLKCNFDTSLLPLDALNIPRPDVGAARYY